MIIYENNALQMYIIYTFLMHYIYKGLK